MNNEYWCSRSWTDIYIDFINGTVQHCCKSLVEKFPNNMTAEFFNSSPVLLERRSQSLKNIKHKQCCYCWNELEKHGSSMRNYWNTWESLDEFSEDWKNLQVKFDNYCNLSCIYCNSHDSSRIAKEKGIKVKSKFNQYNKKIFYDWIKVQNFNNKLISILGGEPTISQNVFEFINFLTQNKYDHNLSLNINTNCASIEKSRNIFTNIINQKSNKWNLAIVISNESDKSSPLIRYGLNVDNFWNNFEYYANYDKVDELGLNPCINKFSLKELSTYLEKCCSIVSKCNKKFWIHGNHVEEPKQLSISSLNIKNTLYIDKSRDVIYKYKNIFTEKNLKQIYSWLDNLYNKIINGKENNDSDGFLNMLAKDKNDNKIKKLYAYE